MKFAEWRWICLGVSTSWEGDMSKSKDRRPRHLSKRYQWSFEAKSPVNYRSFLEAHHMDLQTYFCSPASFRMKKALSLPILQANQRHIPDIQLISTHSNPGIARIACLWRGTLIFIPLFENGFAAMVLLCFTSYSLGVNMGLLWGQRLYPSSMKHKLCLPHRSKLLLWKDSPTGLHPTRVTYFHMDHHKSIPNPYEYVFMYIYYIKYIYIQYCIYI